MSAGNLLYTIPKELAELNYFSDENIKKLLNTDDKDFLAFVTLSVFRTMCVEPKSIIEKIKTQITKSEKKQEVVLDKFLRDTDLRGLLHKFYNVKFTYDQDLGMNVKICDNNHIELEITKLSKLY